jgi:hypothetical protein
VTGTREGLFGFTISLCSGFHDLDDYSLPCRASLEVDNVKRAKNVRARRNVMQAKTELARNHHQRLKMYLEKRYLKNLSQ